MNIQVDGETEKLIREALASGRYARPEDFIAAIVDSWKRQESEEAGPTTDQRSAFDALSDLGVIGCMQPDASDLATNPEHMEGFGG